MAANPALSSILAAVLASDRDLRVRAFSAPEDLRTYMRVVPVDLVVADFDCEPAPADALALILRSDGELAERKFRLIALTRAINLSTRHAAVSAGIDEVIVKPMSPRYLLERVRVRLRAPEGYLTVTGGYHGPDRRGRIAMPLPTERAASRYSDNVVQLFPRGAATSEPALR